MLRFFQERSGGPYPPDAAGPGGLPATLPDIPVCAAFIFLYLCFAVVNMTIFRLNSRRHHKFILSALLFAFCIARTVTLVLRIAWATRLHNVRLAIAAQILVNAGILIIYILNLILAQRILRAKQPRLGWHPAVRIGCKILYLLIGAALVMVITAMVVSLYTLNTHTRSICRHIALAALTYLLVFTCLPFLHLAVAYLLPRSDDEETFGQGSPTSQALIVTLSTGISVYIAGFRAGVAWSPPRPAMHPPWYDSKACFYVFNFGFEILILILLTFSRIDKRFFVPNGSTRPGDYSRNQRQVPPEAKKGTNIMH